MSIRNWFHVSSIASLALAAVPLADARAGGAAALQSVRSKTLRSGQVIVEFELRGSEEVRNDCGLFVRRLEVVKAARTILIDTEIAAPCPLDVLGNPTGGAEFRLATAQSVSGYQVIVDGVFAGRVTLSSRGYGLGKLR